MNTEERLAQINEVSQRILNMPEAERQAYIEQYWGAINEMLNEYKELKRPRQSMVKDPITERTPEQQAALSWDQPTQEAPKQRRRQDRRQDVPDAEETPKAEENTWIVIVKTNPDWTVTDDKGNNYNVDKDWNIVGSAAGTWSDVVTPKGSSDNSWADGSMWPLYWLWGLWALWAYWAIKWLNSKNKVNTDWIKQRMAGPWNFEPVEWYHTPVKTAAENAAEKWVKTATEEWVENVAEKWVKTAAEKWVKNIAEKGVWTAIKKWVKKAIPSFIKKVVF